MKKGLNAFAAMALSAVLAAAPVCAEGLSQEASVPASSLKGARVTDARAERESIKAILENATDEEKEAVMEQLKELKGDRSEADAEFDESEKPEKGEKPEKAEKGERDEKGGKHRRFAEGSDEEKPSKGRRPEKPMKKAGDAADESASAAEVVLEDAAEEIAVDGEMPEIILDFVEITQ